jgi:hypothetical protein
MIAVPVMIIDRTSDQDDKIGPASDVAEGLSGGGLLRDDGVCSGVI